MCRSVPQIDATFTLTSTSVRPYAGILTSRTSAPGAACGLTTANIVSGIENLYKYRINMAKRVILAPAGAYCLCYADFEARSAILRLNSSDFPRGTLKEFHSLARKCLARKTIWPTWYA